MKRLFLAAALIALTACAAPQVNMGEIKTELKAYHTSGAWERDRAAIIAQAQAYVLAAAKTTPKPALVLDIDETSLLNWGPMEANDFGYIAAGPCDALPAGPCGYTAWERSGRATAIPSTLAWFNAAKAAGVAVFFVTGRTEDKRYGTTRNLREAGYDGWTGLILKPQTLKVERAQDYKAPERAKIEAQGYRILASVGDQQSDLDGGYALRTFKLPNRFYFIR
jgi:acid phosphatase